jgi:hypothetical protein
MATDVKTERAQALPGASIGMLPVLASMGHLLSGQLILAPQRFTFPLWSLSPTQPECTSRRNRIACDHLKRQPANKPSACPHPTPDCSSLLYEPHKLVGQSHQFVSDCGILTPS